MTFLDAASFISTSTSSSSSSSSSSSPPPPCWRRRRQLSGRNIGLDSSWGASQKRPSRASHVCRFLFFSTLSPRVWMVSKYPFLSFQFNTAILRCSKSHRRSRTGGASTRSCVLLPMSPMTVRIDGAKHARSERTHVSRRRQTGTPTPALPLLC